MTTTCCAASQNSISICTGSSAAGATGAGITSRSLIAAADSAMYSAKSGGKNRAVLVEVGVTDDGGPAPEVGAGPRRHRAAGA